jgi:DNA-binding beta-propeller fold protein YncE
LQATTTSGAVPRRARSGVPPPGDGTSGRRAVAGLALIVMLFMLLALGFAFSQRWRQGERLVAPGLRHPRGIAVARDDLLAVAEGGPPGRLSWISTSESSRGTMVEGLPATRLDASVEGPVALALSSAGRLYVLVGGCAEPLCASLLARDEAGPLVVVADLAAAARAAGANRSSPWGLVVGPDGSVYVSDAAADTLLSVAPSARLSGDAPAPTSGRRAAIVTEPGRAALASVTVRARLDPGASPRGIALGSDGSLYAALRGAGAVIRVAPDGTITTVADRLSAPIGVGIEPDGGLLVLEQGDPSRAGDGRLIRLDPTHAEQREVISSGFDRPTALVVAADGRAYVSLDGADDQGELIQIRRLGPQPTPRSI